MTDALTRMAVTIPIAVIKMGTALVRAVIAAEGRFTDTVRTDTLAVSRAGAARVTLELATVVAGEARITETGRAMAQTVAVAVVWTAAD